MNKKDTYRSAGVPTKRRFCGSWGDRAKAGAERSGATINQSVSSKALPLNCVPKQFGVRIGHACVAHRDPPAIPLLDCRGGQPPSAVAANDARSASSSASVGQAFMPDSRSDEAPSVLGKGKTKTPFHSAESGSPRSAAFAVRRVIARRLPRRRMPQRQSKHEPHSRLTFSVECAVGRAMT